MAMKKKSASQSAFFNPRVLIGFVLFTIGLLFALAGLSKSVTASFGNPVLKTGMSATMATVQTPGTWTATGSMSVTRRSLQATLLLNGKVLVAGGYSGTAFLSSTELYDPSTGTWTATGSMTSPRSEFSLTRLSDGKVLVAGGTIQSCLTTSSAELYDPSTGTWTPTGSMNVARGGHVATLITSGQLSGRVLVAGGYINQNDGGCGGDAQLASAELYDPVTGSWSITTDMIKERDYSVAAALPDASVLVIGTMNCCPYHWFNSAESYDPNTQLWTLTNSRANAANGAAALLPDGELLVAGGVRGTQPTSVYVADADLFDSSIGTWTASASMSTDRASHTLTLLTSGQVLVAGGFSGGWSIGCFDVTATELYDSSAGTWFPTGNMTAARNSFTTTLLP